MNSIIAGIVIFSAAFSALYFANARQRTVLLRGAWLFVLASSLWRLAETNASLLWPAVGVISATLALTLDVTGQKQRLRR